MADVIISSEDLRGATLLGESDFRELSEDVLLKVSKPWLLSDKGSVVDGAVVYSDQILALTDSVIRPALILEDNLLVSDGDAFVFGDKAFTVVCDGKYALCDDFISYYDKDCEVSIDEYGYEDSSVKAMVDLWFDQSLSKLHSQSLSMSNTDDSDDMDFVIEDISLLTLDDYERCEANISKLSEKTWWLGSYYGGTGQFAYAVDDGGLMTFTDKEDSRVGYSAVNASLGLRPVLHISNLKDLDYSVGDQFLKGGQRWTVISDDLALCNECVGNSCYNQSFSNGMNYRFSDAGDRVRLWGLQHGIEPRSCQPFKVIDETKLDILDLSPASPYPVSEDSDALLVWLHDKGSNDYYCERTSPIGEDNVVSGLIRTCNHGYDVSMIAAISDASSLGLEPGDSFLYNGKEWLTLSNELILCKERYPIEAFGPGAQEERVSEYVRFWTTHNGFSVRDLDYSDDSSKQGQVGDFIKVKSSELNDKLFSVSSIVEAKKSLIEEYKQKIMGLELEIEGIEKDIPVVMEILEHEAKIEELRSRLIHKGSEALVRSEQGLCEEHAKNFVFGADFGGC